MKKYILGTLLMVFTNFTFAQNEIEKVKQKVLAEKNYSIKRSWSTYNKISNDTVFGDSKTTIMHFINDSVVYNNGIETGYHLATKKFSYSINDTDKIISFRIIDSTYIWGWNFSIIFDFISNHLEYVVQVNDTAYFHLKKNREKRIEKT